MTDSLTLSAQNLDESRPEGRRCTRAMCNRENRPDAVFCDCCGMRLEPLKTELRVATVLFADFGGFTSVSEKLTPEEVIETINACFECITAPIYAYGGIVDKYMGDAVMALFGAPLSHEDDAERACRAAYDMQRALQEFNETTLGAKGLHLDMRIGINTGTVVAGMVGSPQHRLDYTVLGDAVNQASRFEAATVVNRIMVGEQTYRLARHAIDFADLGALHLRNKSNPVRVYEVIAPRPEYRRDGRLSEGSEARLVGREQEMAVLHRAMERALGGQGQALVLYGEPGVGKSRLVREFLALIRYGDGRHNYAQPSDNIRIVRARATSYGQSGYRLIADVLRDLYGINDVSSTTEMCARFDEYSHGILQPSGITPDEIAENMALIGSLLGLPYNNAFVDSLDAATRRRLLHTAILQVLHAAITAAPPMVIVCDDMHWADEESVALLAEFVAAIPALPVLFIAIGRSEWASRGVALGLEDIKLETLDEAQSMHLLLERIGALPVDACRLILERTHGNPFFIEEMVRFLIENSKISRRENERDSRVLHTFAALGLPTTVQEVVQARLDSFAPHERSIIQTAAVAALTDTMFRYQTLAHILPPDIRDELPRALERFVENDLIFQTDSPDMRYQFKHALVRDVAYNTLLVAQRRQLHTEVGRAIEDLYRDRSETNMDLLANHYALSSDDGKAITYLARAATRAMAVPALKEARRRYQEAIARSRRVYERDESELPRLRALHLSLAAVMADSNDDDPGFTHMLDTLYAALALCYERPDLIPSSAPSYLRPVTLATGPLSAPPSSDLIAIEDVRRIATLDSLPPKEDDSAYSEVCYWFGWVYEWLGRYDDALLWLQRGIDSLAHQPSSAIGARIANKIGLVHLRQGRMDEAREAAQWGIADATDSNSRPELAQAYNLLSVIQNAQGEAATAIETVRKSIELYTLLGDKAGLSKTRSNLASYLNNLHRFVDALPYLKDSLDFVRRIGDANIIAMTLGNLGETARGTGNITQAIAYAREALDICLAHGSQNFAAQILVNLASYTIDLNDFVSALTYLQRAIDISQQIRSTSFLAEAYRYLAQCYAGLGELESAQAAIMLAIEWGHHTERMLEVAQAQRIRARILSRQGKKDDATAAYTIAIELFTDVGATGERATTLTEMDALHAAPGAESKDQPA